MFLNWIIYCKHFLWEDNKTETLQGKHKRFFEILSKSTADTIVMTWKKSDALYQQQAAVWRFQNQRELIPRTNKDFTKNQQEEDTVKSNFLRHIFTPISQQQESLDKNLIAGVLLKGRTEY